MTPTTDRLWSWAAGLWYRLRAIGRGRRRLDREVDDELAHHLALRAERETQRGAIGDDARRTARLTFGSTARVHEDCRDAHRFVTIEQLVSDLGHGLRIARRQPIFAGVIVAVLSLGIGINVWIFSTMNTLLFRPVPDVASADRLVSIGRTEQGAGFDTLSFPNVDDLRRRTTLLTGLAVYQPLTLTVSANDHTERVRGQLTSANFFAVLGASMLQGRGFDEGEDRPGARVAVVSADFWQRTFGADMSIGGATIVVNRTPLAVVGVAPPALRALSANDVVDVWLPLGTLSSVGRPGLADAPVQARAANWLLAVGRLKPNATLAQARAELGAIGRHLASEFPDDNAGQGIAVEPFGRVEPAARGNLVRQWTLLTAISGLVLLVVCFNVANMLLARGAARTSEMALRLALGAGRGRLVRQVLSEHAILTAAGIAGGALIAWWASGLLQSGIPGGLTPFAIPDIGVDWRVFGFTMAMAIASSLIFSLPPALTAARRSNAMTALRVTQGQHGAIPVRLRSTLAVAQVAVSLALLIGAGLLGRSLRRALDVDLGFVPTGVVSAYYDLQAAGYNATDGARLHRRLLETARQLNGVDAAALVQNVPLQGRSMGLPIEVLADDGVPARSQLVRMNTVSPDFFQTIGTRVVRGREFGAEDTEAAGGVVLVNETCVARCFGGADPIGHEIRVFQETGARRVIGIVADSKYSQPLEDIRPTIYVPLAQTYSPRMALLLRTTTPAAIIKQLPDEFRRIDSTLPAYDVLTLDERLSRALWQPRLLSALVAGFSALTLVLAVLGIYGVVTQVAATRIPEIAVRMALGATPRMILGLVLRQGLRLISLGIVLGVGIAWALSGTLATFLYGVEATDVGSYGLAVVVLTVATLAACLLPARRAAAANPATVLRQ